LKSAACLCLVNPDGDHHDCALHLCDCIAANSAGNIFLSSFFCLRLQSIIDAENTDAWTLMHRFNRAADLLSEARASGGEDLANDMAAIFVWLRFSATRCVALLRSVCAPLGLPKALHSLRCLGHSSSVGGGVTVVLHRRIGSSVLSSSG
jgi:hypothetical protein